MCGLRRSRAASKNVVLGGAVVSSSSSWPVVTRFFGIERVGEEVDVADVGEEDVAVGDVASSPPASGATVVDVKEEFTTVDELSREIVCPRLNICLFFCDVGTSLGASALRNSEKKLENG